MLSTILLGLSLDGESMIIAVLTSPNLKNLLSGKNHKTVDPKNNMSPTGC
jgi:hypothetical protein